MGNLRATRPDANHDSGPMDEPGRKMCPRCGTSYDAVAAFCQQDGAALTRADDRADPYLGQVLLDQFHIEELIGVGGMGRVYRARQLPLNRDVAIKILHPELAQNVDAVRRFQREARVSTNFDHPNIVRGLLFGQLPDGSLYLAMEYLRGRSLVDELARAGRLSAERAIHIAAQVCDAVGAAHAEGVVHRDVKPDNIVLVKRGTDPDFVKVLDFGIARFLWGEHTVATKSGLIFGTARYISPEGASGEPTDARSDVYSIAVLTYQMLAGQTPFDAVSPVALLMKHIHETPAELSERAPDVPPRLADAVMRALSKTPDARHADARELGAAFRAAMAGAESTEASGRARAPTRPSMTAGRGAGAIPAAGRGAAGLDGPVGLVRSEPVAVLASHTLEAAPSPFAITDPMIRVPGLTSPRPLSTAAMVLAAFVLGAAAVTTGAWLIARPEEAVSDRRAEIAALEVRARAALSRGAIDAPVSDNVAELTARILEISPGNEAALELRAMAADRLREEATTAEAQGFLNEARTLEQRALALAPSVTGPTARDFANPSDAPTKISLAEIRVLPGSPRVGDGVTLVTTIGGEVATAARRSPRFRISGPGLAEPAELTAVGDGQGETFAAAYSFADAGRYQVEFAFEGGIAQLSRELEVAPRLSADGRSPNLAAGSESRRAPSPGSSRAVGRPAATVGPSPSPGDAAQPGTAPTPVPAPDGHSAPAVVDEGDDDGIDWRLPEDLPPPVLPTDGQNSPGSGEPPLSQPPPWTGSAL